MWAAPHSKRVAGTSVRQHWLDIGLPSDPLTVTAITLHLKPVIESCNLFIVAMLHLNYFLFIIDEVGFLFWSDLDECAILASLPNTQNDTNLRSCHEKASCVNTVGSYRCDCIRGYAGDGFACIGRILFMFMGSRDGAVARALASHLWGPGSIPARLPYVGVEFAVCFGLAFRVFLWVLRFSSLHYT